MSVQLGWDGQLESKTACLDLETIGKRGGWEIGVGRIKLFDYDVILVKV